jgi:WD40 repeat protein
MIMANNNHFCPYVGLRPYSEDQQMYFFGREKDRNIIIANLYAAPLTILYGASGVGKSSVLLAGVVPLLRTEQRTVAVFFNEWQQADFLSKLKMKCLETARQISEKPLEINPELPLDELLLSLGQATDSTVLLLLDQFEEYFLYHPESTSNNTFESEFSRTINREEVDANFLLSLREDSISRLDRFKTRVPNLMENTLRLEHLDAAAAEEAIRKPLEVYNKQYPQAPVNIENELVSTILEELQTDESVEKIDNQEPHRAQIPIETPLLQLVMERLWKEEGKENSSIMRFSTLKRLGNLKDIVQTHLNEVMDELATGHKELCSRFFDRMVTPSGTKIACRIDDLGKWAGDLADQVPQVIKIFTEKRILRSVNPPLDQPKAYCYEIFHDVLAPAVLAWQMRYAELQSQAEAQRRTEELQRSAEELRQRADEQAKIAERFRRFTLALVTLVLLVLGLVVLAVSAKQRADGNAQKAETERQKADIEKEKASKSEIIARSAERDAHEEAQVAVEKEKEAFKAREQAESARIKAEKESQISLSREVNALAISSLRKNPELSILLGLQALSIASPLDKNAKKEAINSLQQATQSSRSKLTIHNKYIAVRVTFSPVDKRLAAAYADGTVKVYNASTGQELLKLSGHKGVINDVVFSPDGKRLATAGADKTVKIWDSSTGIKLQDMNAHNSEVLRVLFCPKTKRLASAGINGTIKIWDVNSGSELKTLPGHKNPVVSFLFSKDATKLASVSTDGTSKVWDLESGNDLGTVVGCNLNAISAVLSPDGSRMAVANVLGMVNVCKANTKEEKILLTLYDPSKSVYSIAYNSDGTRLATASSDGTARVWDAISGEELFSLAGHTNFIQDIAFSPDGTVVATASSDKKIIIWDATSMHDQEILSLAFSPDGKKIATSSKDMTVKIWDTTSLRELHRLSGHAYIVDYVNFNPAGTRMATASYDGTAKIWDTITGKDVFTLPGHTKWLSAVVFSPDGNRIATGSLDKTVKIWNASNGNELRTLSHEFMVTGVKFSPKGDRLAVCGGDASNGFVSVWDASSGGKLLHIKYNEPVSGLSFSPDGKRLAIAKLNGTGRIMDANSGKGLVKIDGHTNQLLDITFSPDGKYLATASQDKTAKIWDSFSGRELQTFSHRYNVNAVAFTPDGRYLATASGDKVVHFFPLNVVDLLKLARKRITRSLTKEECRKYLHMDTCPPLPWEKVLTSRH